MREIELLAPARDAAIGMAAVRHGADAVYIGPQAFGARSAAANSTADIARLCDYAHRFCARVYATVNTILYEHELKEAERLVRDLYRVGVDAIIVQDMGLLRLDLPPIALHASTQCDTRTVEKARFLEEAGFSQIVLARELTLEQISEICAAVRVPVECFVHGALCVSYSGRCHASYAACSRSANRGECAQLCRLPYDLMDADGRTLARSKHLLCLKDLNATPRLEDMLAAGVSSFKIEGRLKDLEYVKNVTAHYRRALDRLIAANPDRYRAASCGRTELHFEPDVSKSFNRGFTDYFLSDRHPLHIASLATPKSQGEPLAPGAKLNAGDGVATLRHGRYEGWRINHPTVVRPADGRLFRTLDYRFQSMLGRDDTAERVIDIDVDLYDNRVECADTRGQRVVLPLDVPRDVARKPIDPRPAFSKLGGTIYRLRTFENHLDPTLFIPVSALSKVRREMIEALDEAAAATLPRTLRRPENRAYPYPQHILTFADNVSNSLARAFYADHGATEIPPALECSARTSIPAGTRLMTTRHCVLRELGLCRRESREPLREPLTLRNAGGASFTLRFDCAACEMHVLK